MNFFLYLILTFITHTNLLLMTSIGTIWTIDMMLLMFYNCDLVSMPIIYLFYLIYFYIYDCMVEPYDVMIHNILRNHRLIFVIRKRCWSHRYKHSTVIITNWLTITKYAFGIGYFPFMYIVFFPLLPTRLLQDFEYHSVWNTSPRRPSSQCLVACMICWIYLILKSIVRIYYNWLNLKKVSIRFRQT